MRLSPLLLSWLLAASGIANAQARPVDASEPDDAFPLGQIVVTGKRLPDLGVGADTLDDEAIYTFNRNSLDEAARLIPGVSASNSGGSRNERLIFVRGFDRFRVPLLIDGIRVYLPADNRLDHGRFLTPDIAEIQVAKGHASVLDEPGALGGLVNLVTRKPSDELEIEGRGTMTLDRDLDYAGYNVFALIGTRQDTYYLQASYTRTVRDHFDLAGGFAPTPNEDGGERDFSDTRDWRTNVKAGYTPNATDEYSISYTRQEGRKNAPIETTFPLPSQRFWIWPYWNLDSIYFPSTTALGSSATLKTRAYRNSFSCGADFPSASACETFLTTITSSPTASRRKGAASSRASGRGTDARRNFVVYQQKQRVQDALESELGATAIADAGAPIRLAEKRVTIHRPVSRIDAGARALVDSFGRRVDYLRVSVTDRCDLRCVYCMPANQRFLPKAEILTLDQLDTLCSTFIGLGVRKLRLSGGEPLLRRGFIDLARRLSRHLESGKLEELTLTTNGTRLAEHAEELAAAGVRRINVSVDSLDPATFARLTRGGDLGRVLAGIEAAQAAGIRIKINIVALSGANEDELPELIAWAHAGGMDASLIETMPLGEIEQDRTDQYLPLTTVRAGLEERWTLEPLDVRSCGPARYVRVAETGGKLGFITPLTHNFCASCNRVRLTATGILYMCLGQDDHADLRTPLREGASALELEEVILGAIARKPEKHHFLIEQRNARPALARPMSRTGG